MGTHCCDTYWTPFGLIAHQSPIFSWVVTISFLHLFRLFLQWSENYFCGEVEMKKLWELPAVILILTTTNRDSIYSLHTLPG